MPLGYVPVAFRAFYKIIFIEFKKFKNICFDL